MQDFIKFIKDYIDKVLEDTNGIALSLMINKNKMAEIGTLTEQSKKDIEKIRTENMAVYTFCQDLYKKIVQYEKSIESGEKENGEN